MPTEWGLLDKLKLVTVDGTEIAPITDLHALDMTMSDDVYLSTPEWMYDIDNLPECSCEVKISITPKWKQHRLLGWRGRTALRPRYKQRLKALLMQVKAVKDYATD